MNLKKIRGVYDREQIALLTIRLKIKRYTVIILKTH